MVNGFRKLAVVHGSDNHLFTKTHKIGRAADPEKAAVQHLRVNHGGLHVLVAQKLLKGADVLAQPQPCRNPPW